MSWAPVQCRTKTFEGLALGNLSINRHEGFGGCLLKAKVKRPKTFTPAVGPPLHCKGYPTILPRDNK